VGGVLGAAPREGPGRVFRRDAGPSTRAARRPGPAPRHRAVPVEGVPVVDAILPDIEDITVELEDGPWSDGLGQGDDTENSPASEYEASNRCSTTSALSFLWPPC